MIIKVNAFIVPIAEVYSFIIYKVHYIFYSYRSLVNFFFNSITWLVLLIMFINYYTVGMI